MSTAAYVDGMLVDWGASLFNQKPVAAVAAKRSMSGLYVPPRKKKPAGGAVGQGGVTGGANSIRSKLGSITKKPPQVMVKISGGGKGMKQIKDHLDYISRNGKIDLENEDGDILSGKEDLGELRDEWQVSGGFRIPEEGDKRESFNIIFSMPEGTNELAVKRAVRDFAAQEFDNHRYAMALHTFDTDPDPEPSKHPHVHLVVKARGFDGIRLNPRKADLQRWREGFAEALREHGVEAAATKRVQRMQRTQSPKVTRYLSTEKQMTKTGRVPTKVRRSTPDPIRVQKAKDTAKQIWGGYREVAKALAASEDVEDRKLAVGLVHRLDEQKRHRPRDVAKPQRRDTER